MRRFHSLVKFPDFLQAELDRNLPNFFDGLEIGDATLADGRRVVLFTWKQVGIISAEISEECWIPIAFGLLPDKKRDTYDTFLGLLKTALSSHNLELSARTVLSDFEVSINYKL